MQDNNLYNLTKTTEFRLKLYPKDFSKVKDFYENALGYPIKTFWDEPNHQGVMFDTGTGVIELLTPKDAYIPIVGSDVSLQVKDVWELWEKLKDHPNIQKAIEDRPWGDTSFCIADPEGFQVIFFTLTNLNPNKLI